MAAMTLIKDLSERCSMECNTNLYRLKWPGIGDNIDCSPIRYYIP